jgi:MOSC domain-containing protein YiiM
VSGRILGLFAGGESFVKEARPALDVDPLGARGDRHYGRSEERALLLVPEATYDALRAEGIDVPHGSLGENLVASGLPAEDLRPGTRLRIGALAFEVAGGCTVCASLAQVHPRLPKASYRRRGVYLKVRDGGRLHSGDEVRIVSQPKLERIAPDSTDAPSVAVAATLAEETA